MKAIILAAGEGIRLRPFTFSRPKSMIPIADKPILEYAINSLKECGLEDVTLVVGYRKESIMNYFEDGLDFGVRIEYVEQEQQLGTAHAIKQVEECVDDRFVVLNGDNLVEERLIKDILDNETGNITVVTALREDARGYGVIIPEGEKVVQIIEKPPSPARTQTNTAVYLLNREVI